MVRRGKPEGFPEFGAYTTVYAGCQEENDYRMSAVNIYVLRQRSASALKRRLLAVIAPRLVLRYLRQLADILARPRSTSSASPSLTFQAPTCGVKQPSPPSRCTSPMSDDHMYQPASDGADSSYSPAISQHKYWRREEELRGNSPDTSSALD